MKKSRYELYPVRLPPGVSNPNNSRTVYINIPVEFFKEDLAYIYDQLESMLLEEKPYHTPDHSGACPACNWEKNNL